MVAVVYAVRYIVHSSVGSAREDAMAALGESVFEAKTLVSTESALLCDIYAVAARAVSSSNSPPVPELALAATCTVSVGALRYPTIVLPGGSFVDDNDPRSIASLCATITASPRFIAAAAKAAPVFTVAISAVPMPDRPKDEKKPGAASSTSSSFTPSSADRKPDILYSEGLRDAPLADRCRYAAVSASFAMRTTRAAREKPHIQNSYSFRSIDGAEIPMGALKQMTNLLTDEDLLWMEQLFFEAADGAPSVTMESGLIKPLTFPPPPTEGIDGLQEKIFSLFLWQM